MRGLQSCRNVKRSQMRTATCSKDVFALKNASQSTFSFINEASGVMMEQKTKQKKKKKRTAQNQHDVNPKSPDIITVNCDDPNM